MPMPIEEVVGLDISMNGSSRANVFDMRDLWNEWRKKRT
jgi:hypothetical protein